MSQSRPRRSTTFRRTTPASRDGGDETQALLDDEFPRAWQSTTFSALGFGGAHPVASSVLSGDQDYGELKIEQNALFDDGIENARQRLAEILDRLPTPPTVTAEVSVAERRSRQSPEVLPDSPGNGVFGKWIRPDPDNHHLRRSLASDRRRCQSDTAGRRRRFRRRRSPASYRHGAARK